ncbi:MAG: hypothetical protein HS113_14210 [Verrucomicrobiales bacterium]|nr:hypothetical protein [Verrucomicrobiales bacterium]
MKTVQELYLEQQRRVAAVVEEAKRRMGQHPAVTEREGDVDEPRAPEALEPRSASQAHRIVDSSDATARGPDIQRAADGPALPGPGLQVPPSVNDLPADPAERARLIMRASQPQPDPEERRRLASDTPDWQTDERRRRQAEKDHHRNDAEERARGLTGEERRRAWRDGSRHGQEQVYEMLFAIWLLVGIAVIAVPGVGIIIYLGVAAILYWCRNQVSKG